MADYDLVVIGSGPAGEKGAVQAASSGKKVAVVEKAPVLGGAAANTGTLPSKTLRETALYLSGFRNRGLYGVDFALKERVSLDELLYRERKVKEGERARVAWNLERHGVRLLQGTATLPDPHTVEVLKPDGAIERLSTGVILLATGSSPHRPAIYPFEDNRIHDSDELLEMPEVPASLAVIGAGVIGSEYACMFAALGIPVTLVEQKEQLLPFLDAELSSALVEHMRALGIDLAMPDSVKAVDASGHLIKLELESGRRLEVRAVLVAAGRTGNTRGLNLEAHGIALDNRGRVVVNERYQTAVPHIYAAGDVIGFPALASTSMEQARIAVGHAFDLEYKKT
ncbi:MAG TPA: FAD-dependent oxidoreductase, partial [Myxococcaceae bacterium]|nr:FAD-dependent oxidoreductase [Myxococcaceae bacterium]